MASQTAIDFLQRVAAGQCKIKRYPSGQWSRGGNKFGRTREISVLVERGWIEKIAVNNAGVEIYDVTADGAEAAMQSQ